MVAPLMMFIMLSFTWSTPSFVYYIWGEKSADFPWDIFYTRATCLEKKDSSCLLASKQK